MSSRKLEKQGTTFVGAFMRSQIVILELFAIGIGLHLLQQRSVSAQTTLAMLLFCVFMFTFLTGKGFPHFRNRGKALLLLILAGFFSLQGAVLFDQQREALLAKLRENDPTAYLIQLRDIDESRWFAELRELNPAVYRPSEILLMLQGGRRRDEWTIGKRYQSVDGEAEISARH